MKTLVPARKRLTAMILVLLLLIGAPGASAEVFSAIVTSNAMPVYGELALSRKLGELEKDTVVRVVGFSNTVAKISYKGYTGFALISDMKTVDEVAKKAVTGTAATVYEFENRQGRSARIKAGTRLYVLSSEEGTAKVEKNGIVAYMDASALVEAADDWSVAATPTPAPEATPAPSAAPGGGVPGVVTEDGVKVYASASASSARLGTLRKGQTVNVVSWDSQWAYIELQGHYGYCSVRSLTRADSQPTPMPTAYIPETSAPEATRRATVSADAMPVYQTASTGGRVLGTLKKGR